MSRLSFLQDLLASVFDRHTDSTSRADDRPLEELCEALLSGRGELSGNRLSRTILERVESGDEETQKAFFELLLNKFDIDANAAVTAATAYAENNSPKNWRRLLQVTEPRRQELLKRINRLPGATGRLVLIRERLLPLLAKHPSLVRLDIDFEHLFNSWFNRGFLVMRQIDWDTPASILERIIHYEAVHAINDLTDLRGRLEPADRRCFAFFHPAMPDDPLIFVEVALTASVPASIQSVLANQREILSASDADTAVFYSISNCQVGLKGVSFGNFLIKQVASELVSEFPNLKTIRTLSPIPFFMRWVKGELEGTSKPSEALLVADKLSRGKVSTEGDDEMLEVRKLAAEYLINARRPDAQPMDPVARFHLGNGASLSEIIPAADLSKKGLSQSAGVMVSYLYDLDAVGRNHEAYAHERVVTTSREVENLVGSVTEKLTRKKPVNA